jgi:L-fuconolactonase
MEYPWIGPSVTALRRDFLPPDLRKEIDAAGIDGVVSVQARTTLDETRWLLDLADQNDFIRGVVGWAPLVSENLEADLIPLAGRAKLKAIREVLQDLTTDDLILSDEFSRGVGLLAKHGLAYDLLIFERQLPAAIQLVDRCPKTTFVLDHIAKPRIRESMLSPWIENMKELARRPNVYCKISGIATEADHPRWTTQALKPYFDGALDAFGPSRLMFGSDWPVCLLATGYQRWADTVRDWITPLSDAERKRIMGDTAVEAYRL